MGRHRSDGQRRDADLRRMVRHDPRIRRHGHPRQHRARRGRGAARRRAGMGRHPPTRPPPCPAGRDTSAIGHEPTPFGRNGIAMTEHRLMPRPSSGPANGYPTTTTAPASVMPATTVEAPATDGAQGEWPPPPSSGPPAPPQAPVPPPQPPRRRRPAWLIAAVAAALVLMLVIATGALLAGRTMHPSAQAQASFGRSGMSGQAPAGPPATPGPGVNSAQISSVAAKVDPGIVDINTILGYEHGSAAGTGIVLGADGLVLTNNHVVAGATGISVTDIGN